MVQRKTLLPFLHHAARYTELVCISANTSESKEGATSLSLQPVLALRVKFCLEIRKVSYSPVSLIRRGPGNCTLSEGGQKMLCARHSTPFFSCCMTVLAAVTSHRGSWTHNLESPTLNGGEQTCIFPQAGIVPEAALCWVAATFRVRPLSQGNTSGRKERLPADTEHLHVVVSACSLQLSQDHCWFALSSLLCSAIRKK